MKRLTLKKMKIFFTACFAFLAIGASALLASPASKRTVAEEASGNILSTEFRTDGASVRVFNNQKKTDGSGERELVETSKKGIRFHVETGEGYVIPESDNTLLLDVTADINEKNGSYKLADGYKTYTLILPTRLLNGDLTPSTDKVMAIDTTEYWFTDSEYNWESVAYVYNVPQEMYTDSFSYRGIICKVDGETETVVAQTEVSERSLAYVAKRAYNDTIDKNSNYWGSEDLDEQAAPLIKAFVPTYNIVYKDANNIDLGSEEVLWGDTPQNVPANDKGAWYDTVASEEFDVSKTMSFTENRELTLVTTSSNEFVLTGVAAHTHTNNYDGVKVFATLPVNDFTDGTEFDIKAVKITHSGNGTFADLAGVWAMQENGQMRLFFGFKEGTDLANGDTLTLSADSIFYAKGVMYKLSEEYVIDCTQEAGSSEVDYGMFLGYLNNAHVKAIYNAAEDSSGKNGNPDDFTIRVEFYDDIMITDSYTFVHDDSTAPVYIQCGEDKNLQHIITGGEYYWVEDVNQLDGYTKILELITTDSNGTNLNTAYGKHTGDELHGLAGTKLVQNGGYYIFEDEMYARFLPTSTNATTGVVEGIWTVGNETGAYGSEEFAKTGSYEAGDTEVRFTTTNLWFDTNTSNGAGTLTIENMSGAENAIYHTSVDGTVTAITKIIYHGYNSYQILGIRGIPTPQAGDTITIVAGTRLWFKQSYVTLGDLVGKERTKDVVFCYNGQYWFSGYDASNNVTVTNADVGGIDTDGSHGGEIRLWMNGTTDKQVLNAELMGYMIIDPRFPSTYNGTQISGINTAFNYGSANDMVSLVTGVTTAKEGDYFYVPAGSVWWTTFYGGEDPANRAVIFAEDVEATFDGSAWVKGNKQATFDYVGNNFTLIGMEKGYLYQGKSYTFTVTPNSGYVISSITIGGVEQAINVNGEYTFTAQAANTVKVETVVGYEVRFDVADGAIVAEGAIIDDTIKPVAQNGSFTFTVAANEGYKIVDVIGAKDNGNGTYTVSPTANMTVTITTEKLYKVTFVGENATANVMGIGSITNGKFVWVENGTSMAFTITPANNYTVVRVAGATKIGTSTYEATVNGADLTIEATALANSSFVDITERLQMEDRSNYGNVHENEIYVAFLDTGITNGEGDSANNWFNTTVVGAWYVGNNDVITANGGVDIMEYIYVNGTSARAWLNANNGGKNSCDCWLSNPAAYPVYVESTAGSGLMMKLSTAVFNSQPITITVKAGFSITNSLGDLVVVTKDVNFVYQSGSAITKNITSYNFNVGLNDFTGATVTANGNNVSNGASLAEGTIITIAPEESHNITSVKVNGVELSANNDGTYTYTLLVNSEISITTAIKTYTITWSNPTGATITVNGNNTGSIIVEHGTKVSVTVGANEGYTVTDVFAYGSSITAASNTFTATGDTTITLTVKKLHKVSWTNPTGATITVTASGSSSTSGSVTVAEGTSISVVITPSTGYRLDTVSGIGNVSVDKTHATANTFTYTVNAATTISATTVKMYKVSYSGTNATISVTANGANVSNNSYVDENTTISVSTAPSTGYHVTDVLANGNSIGTTSGTYKVISATTISNAADLNEYTVSASTDGYTTITSSTSVKVKHGNAATFTLSIPDGATVKCDNANVSISGNTATLNNVTGNTTISFTTWYTITLSNTNNAKVSNLSNGMEVQAGVSYEFTVASVTATLVQQTGCDVNSVVLTGGTFNDGSTTKNGAGTYTASFTSKPTVTINATATKYDSCLVEGTLITLANGSQKAIENLTYEDELLVFNHLTGKIEAGQISFIDHADQESSLYKIVNLQFSDGSKLRIVSEHGLFDLTENKYVYISMDNMLNYIGHTFYATSYNGVEFVQYEVVLTNAYITEEIVKIYSPVTVPHTNCFAESLLTVTPMPNGVRGFMNIFDFDDELKYDETTMKLDIETYGLYTYEDFAEYLTLEEFENSMLKYLKVSVGKGYLTYEDIVSCIFAEFE